MSEYIVELPMSGAADEFIAEHGVDDCRLYGYKLTGEIVRCRDCVHFDGLACEKSACWLCYETQEVKPDGYCAWGERKEESE